MNDYKNFTEYVVRPEDTAKTKLLRVFLICAYTIFSAVYLFVFWAILEGIALVLLLPFLLFAIYKLTWRFTRVEYEYAIEAGELTVAAIYGGATRRVKCRVYLPEATLIVPYDSTREQMLAKNDISEVKRFANEDSESAYVCVYPDAKHGKKCALIFETNAEAQRILRLCNPVAFSSR